MTSSESATVPPQTPNQITNQQRQAAMSEQQQQTSSQQQATTNHQHQSTSDRPHAAPAKAYRNRVAVTRSISLLNYTSSGHRIDYRRHRPISQLAEVSAVSYLAFINALIYISVAAALLPTPEMARSQSPAAKPSRVAAARRHLANSGGANSAKRSGKDPPLYYALLRHLVSDVHPAPAAPLTMCAWTKRRETSPFQPRPQAELAPVQQRPP
ncbi:hypothetical protein HPB51_004371 [Rhipicephalus microplus]|uniref:Uncharacterized protein n=1 Tax=Rhipicephalus microplus TaxID=6941 RepID=A0A9J6ELB6_RHIMP|nr:hypothetical protein HPB51_004371 [Rhipicephalus microplus]